MTKKKMPNQLKSMQKLPNYDCALADAVRKFNGKVALAEALNIGKVNPKTGGREGGRQMISEWFRRGSVPKKHALKINQLTGISLERLLADFPPYRPQSTPKEPTTSEKTIAAQQREIESLTDRVLRLEAALESELSKK